MGLVIDGGDDVTVWVEMRRYTFVVGDDEMQVEFSYDELSCLQELLARIKTRMEDGK